MTARPTRRSFLSGTVLTLGAVALTGVVLGPQLTSRASEAAVVLPEPAADLPAASGLQKAVLAGGCFWGVQAVFQHTEGVVKAVSGYAGGTPQSANYDAVSAGRTRHAEAVEVTYDPAKISYGRILQIFFSVVHDPTQRDRQGPDVGPQYRSAIFPANDAQKRVAQGYIAQLDAAKTFPRAIVTTLEPLTAFHAAEAYHQDYAARNPNAMYIVVHDRPKVENLKRLFSSVYRAKPVLVADAKG